MSRRNAWIVVGIILQCQLSGCGIGYNRMLFATRTNVGFEVDTKPPVVQLNVDRLEGVIAPQFENGQKLPVMASFKFQNEESFAPHVGSAFATGDAAVALAALYNEQTPAGGWQSRMDLVRGPPNPDGSRGPPTIDSSLRLDRKPRIQDGAAMLFAEKGPDGEYYQQDDVRPVFFGTDTSLGLKIAWSGATGVFPDSAKLGFNRKELAWVPIALRQEGSQFAVKTSSLLATIDAGINQPALDEGAPKTDIQYVQYFATGDAATLLSLQEEVRKAMLVRLDPNRDTYAALAADRFDTAGRRTLFAILNNLRNQVDVVAASSSDPRLQQEAQAIQTTLGNADILPTIKFDDFQRYDYKMSTSVLELVPTPEAPTGIDLALDYRDQLHDAVNHLQRAVLDPNLKDPASPADPISPTDRQALDDQKMVLYGKLQAFEARLLRDKAVIALVRFFISDS